jgi:hypothetical protein
MSYPDYKTTGAPRSLDWLVLRWEKRVARSKRMRDAFKKNSPDYRFLKVEHETSKTMLDELRDVMANRTE